MNFGLDSETLETIIDSITKFPEIEEALIFGSRAMGNYKPASDIDIALKGDLKSNTTSSLTGVLSEAPRFPYKVDVIDYMTIGNLDLKKHIDEFGKVIFSRANIRIQK